MEDVTILHALQLLPCSCSLAVGGYHMIRPEPWVGGKLFRKCASKNDGTFMFSGNLLMLTFLNQLEWNLLLHPDEIFHEFRGQHRSVLVAHPIMKVIRPKETIMLIAFSAMRTLRTTMTSDWMCLGVFPTKVQRWEPSVFRKKGHPSWECFRWKVSSGWVPRFCTTFGDWKSFQL